MDGRRGRARRGEGLTIDAHDVDELRTRLHAARAGLRDQHLELALPDLEHDTRALRYLGPRFGPDTVARLRRVVCPLAAGALTPALATDNDAPWLAETRAAWTDPRGRHVRAYTGTFRIPPQARPMLRALLLDRAAHPGPPPALFVDPAGTPLRARRIAHRVRVGADLAGLRRPGAARAQEKRYTSETFATSFTGAVSLSSVTNPTLPRT